MDDYSFTDYGTVTLAPAPTAREMLALSDTPPPTLAAIKRFQDALALAPDQVTFEPNHYFADGAYLRELYVEANKDIVGKMHRHEHLVMLVSGECVVVTTEGREHMVGPKIWTSTPGVKRVIRTLSNCHFITFHLNPTNTRDLDEIEAEVIVPESQIDYENGGLLTDERGPFKDELQGVYA